MNKLFNENDFRIEGNFADALRSTAKTTDSAFSNIRTSFINSTFGQFSGLFSNWFWYLVIFIIFIAVVAIIVAWISSPSSNHPPMYPPMMFPMYQQFPR